MMTNITSFGKELFVDALHCGAGCSLSDLVGSWIFYYLLNFAIFNQKIFGEWLFDYLLALIIGVLFQLCRHCTND